MFNFIHFFTNYFILIVFLMNIFISHLYSTSYLSPPLLAIQSIENDLLSKKKSKSCSTKRSLYEFLGIKLFLNIMNSSYNEKSIDHRLLHFDNTFLLKRVKKADFIIIAHEIFIILLLIIFINIDNPSKLTLIIFSIATIFYGFYPIWLQDYIKIRTLNVINTREQLKINHFKDKELTYSL